MVKRWAPNHEEIGPTSLRIKKGGSNRRGAATARIAQQQTVSHRGGRGHTRSCKESHPLGVLHRAMGREREARKKDNERWVLCAGCWDGVIHERLMWCIGT